MSEQEFKQVLTDGLMKAILDQAMEEDDEKRRAPDIAAKMLIDAHIDLIKKHGFKVGDLVQQKRGLDMYTHPKVGSPALVTKILDKPIIETDQDSNSTSFRTPMDMVILVLIERGKECRMAEVHVDSRRFEPYKGKIA